LRLSRRVSIVGSSVVLLSAKLDIRAHAGGLSHRIGRLAAYHMRNATRISSQGYSRSVSMRSVQKNLLPNSPICAPRRAVDFSVSEGRYPASG